MTETNRPGGELGARPLHFIWICDASGSMAEDGKIECLNNAIREAIPHMQAVAKENPNADVLVRALTFSDGAQWHIGTPVKVDDFRWTDIQAGGLTDMGRALSMIADTLKQSMPDRGLPPVLALLSDGLPTDDFNKGLNEMMSQGWGKKAVRIAVAIGRDADLEVLQRFIGHAERKPLQANNAEQLATLIRWTSTAVLKSASQPASQPPGAGPSADNVPIPAPPPMDPAAGDEIW